MKPKKPKPKLIWRHDRRNSNQNGPETECGNNFPKKRKLKILFLSQFPNPLRLLGDFSICGFGFGLGRQQSLISIFSLVLRFMNLVVPPSNTVIDP
ncbi:hypothetical protein VNO77_43854 [Canavalia gladiata]|uniref:Uncharacterized protein n=1 Tax=Canavalia gladiata TaxID=3824 RepID=A0AAN9JXI3_CANGL